MQQTFEFIELDRGSLLLGCGVGFGDDGGGGDYAFFVGFEIVIPVSLQIKYGIGLKSLHFVSPLPFNLCTFSLYSLLILPLLALLQRPLPRPLGLLGCVFGLDLTLELLLHFELALAFEGRGVTRPRSFRKVMCDDRRSHRSRLDLLSLLHLILLICLRLQ